MNEPVSPQPSAEKTKNDVTPEAIPLSPVKKNRYIIDDSQMSPVVKHWLVRFLVVFIGIMVLQIPLYMVKDLAEERESYASSAEAAIAAGWGKEQVIEDILSGDDLPEKLSVKSVITPEIRYRGIYQSVVYVVQNDIDMEFDKVAKFIEVGISDSNGLLDVSAEINGKSADFTLEGSNTVKIKVPENVSSKVNCSFTRSVAGFLPILTKRPLISSCCTSPLTRFFTLIPERISSPNSSTTSLFQTKRILEASCKGL